MAPSSELPLLRALPRAWIAFGRAPWRCVGLASLVLLSGAGLAVIGEDLRRLGLAQLGDLAVLLSLLLPLLPLLGLLQLADALLPPRLPQRPAGRRSFLLRQSLALLLMESMLPLGAIALIQSLSSFSTVQRERFVPRAIPSGLCGSRFLVNRRVISMPSLVVPIARTQIAIRWVARHLCPLGVTSWVLWSPWLRVPIQN